MFYDSARDPVDNSIPNYYHWRSGLSTGNSTTIFPDLIIPSSPNYPPMSTATPLRYMVNLPGEPYYDGIVAGTYPIVVKNINTSSILTRVAYNGILTANTYKVFPATAETPARMELHVGTGSNHAGDKIAFDGYFINNILSADKIGAPAALVFATTASRNVGFADRLIGSTENFSEVLSAYTRSTGATPVTAGGKIILLEGTYNMSYGLMLEYNFIIEGQGSSVTRIVWNGTTNSSIVNMFYPLYSKISIKDLSIIGSSYTIGYNAMISSTFLNYYIHNVSFQGHVVAIQQGGDVNNCSFFNFHQLAVYGAKSVNNCEIWSTIVIYSSAYNYAGGASLYGIFNVTNNNIYVNLIGVNNCNRVNNNNINSNGLAVYQCEDVHFNLIGGAGSPSSWLIQYCLGFTNNSFQNLSTSIIGDFVFADSSGAYPADSSPNGGFNSLRGNYP